jgi:hypothetical protein
MARDPVGAVVQSAVHFVAFVAERVTIGYQRSDVGGFTRDMRGSNGPRP